MLSKRERKLLQLLFNQKDYQPASYFRNLLNVSTKTIYKDLESIQTELNGTGIEIEKVPRKGIRLQFKEEHKEYIRLLVLYEKTIQEDYTPEKRQLIILSKELFSKDSLTYQEYANLLYVTPQTVKNDRDEVVLFFDTYGVEFSKINNEDVYEETLIQKLIHDYIQKQKMKKILTRDNLELLFDKELIEKTENYVDDMLESAQISLSNYMKQSLFHTILIFLSRVRMGKHIENERKMMFLEIQNMELYMSSMTLTEKMNKDLGFVFTTSDIQYLSSCLFSHGVQPFIVDTNMDEYFDHEVLKMISQMSLLLGVNFSNDQDLPKFLLSHIIPMVHRLNTGIHVRNPLLDSIKKQYSTMFSLVRLVISGIEESFDIILPDDEIGFLTIHFQLAFEKIEVTKHVLIVCSFGFVTSELILNRIERNISKNIIVEVSDEKTLKKVDTSAIDLIISTVPLELENQVNPIIYVSPLPTNEEISKISSMISKIDQFGQNFSSRKDIKKELIVNYLDPRLLFFEKEFESKEDILTFISKKMTELSFVEKSFEQHLLKREEMGSTGLDIGVAFPHADPKTVLETKLSIVCLKNPVLWGATKVSVVCLLAISEEDMSEAKSIIATLYDLFNRVGYVDKLATVKSTKELIDLIVSKGE
ncbi:BglG family transcription antiterminator [Vagococcus carniphilus]|uniref:BglG family transcription antiterminator n=1 Tax=Vagococcus carniphilus TaxID=218144 RepID=UPI00288FCF97|nr:PTS sugar transporter subunit IIA [Vagococcus carniphilus]MDT2813959.1 PTS sugar transporter subunit IIA [Vagococcus carniphilus]MDT2864014.1 PTS sugar transporter subunit IIA [Vagococcus carniphilus]